MLKLKKSSNKQRMHPIYGRQKQEVPVLDDDDDELIPVLDNDDDYDEWKKRVEKDWRKRMTEERLKRQMQPSEEVDSEIDKVAKVIKRADRKTKDMPPPVDGERIEDSFYRADSHTTKDDFVKGLVSEMLLGDAYALKIINKHKKTRGTKKVFYKNYRENDGSGRDLNWFKEWEGGAVLSNRPEDTMTLQLDEGVVRDNRPKDTITMQWDGGVVLDNQPEVGHYALINFANVYDPDVDRFIIEIDVTRSRFRVHKAGPSDYIRSNEWSSFINPLLMRKSKERVDAKSRLEFTIPPAPFKPPQPLHVNPFQLETPPLPLSKNWPWP